MICQYCGKEAIWGDNAMIYGKSFGRSHKCYYCKDCDAYVGCHNNTKKPLGTLANRELRKMRQYAHSLFDPLWQNGLMKRGQAYKFLAKEFKKDEIHIGDTNETECKAIIEFLEKFYKTIETLDPKK